MKYIITSSDKHTFEIQMFKGESRIRAVTVYGYEEFEDLLVTLVYDQCIGFLKAVMYNQIDKNEIECVIEDGRLNKW